MRKLLKILHITKEFIKALLFMGPLAICAFFFHSIIFSIFTVYFVISLILEKGIANISFSDFEGWLMILLGFILPYQILILAIVFIHFYIDYKERDLSNKNKQD